MLETVRGTKWDFSLGFSKKTRYCESSMCNKEGKRKVVKCVKMCSHVIEDQKFCMSVSAETDLTSFNFTSDIGPSRWMT